MASSGRATGFTLVEVAVSAAIIIVLVTIIIIQVRTLSPQQAINAGAETARSVFVLARSNAFNGRLCCSDQLPAGYGVVATLDGHPDNVLSLYADLDDDHVYSSTDEIITRITLPTNVDVTRCYDTTVSVTAGTCDLSFATTGNTVSYFDGSTPRGTWYLQLTYYGGTTSATLQINGFGIIQ